MIQAIQGRLFWLGSALVIALLCLTLELQISWMPYVMLGLFVLVLFFLYPERLFWFTVVAIPISFEYSFTSHFGTDFPDELLMLSSTGAFLLMLPFLAKRPLKESVREPVFLFILFQYVWSVVSTYHSQETWLSTKFILSKLWYIIPFVLIPQFILKDKMSFRRLAYCISIPVLAICIYTMVRHSTYGFSFVSINEAASPIFRNHVTYAASVSMALSVVLSCLVMYKKLRSKIVWVLALLLLLAAIYFSYTRGSWLSAFLSIIMIIILKWNKIGVLLLAISLMMLGTIYYVTYKNNYLALKPDFEKTIIHDNLSEHLDAMYSMKELSTSERIYRWVAGFRMSSVHPLSGFGPATFYSQYKQYTDARFRTYVSDNPEKSTVHNYFLLTTVEQGFPGLIILLSLLFMFFLRCQKLFIRIADPFYKTVIMVLVSAMTHIVVVNFFSDMIETDKIGTFYFLCFGVLLVIERKIRSGDILIKDQSAGTTNSAGL